MDGLLLGLISPSIVVLCFCIGCAVKHVFKRIDNRYIPVIVACSGAVLACLAAHGVTLDALAQGIISGWASTGVHQTFKNLKDGGERNG